MQVQIQDMLHHWGEDGMEYSASHTGIVIDEKIVLSFVNGSMCRNTIGLPVDASSFDPYAIADLNAWFHGKYNRKVVALAYFDPATKCYTLTETRAPGPDELVAV